MTESSSPPVTPAGAARILVGTAGHIDHGKSALVRALTGTDPDRLPEEKARGITIDLGFAHASWDGISFSFVDVPGHERFVRTMVAGAAGIDVALLAVASDDSVMPQTREHLAILELLGVRHGVLARTKADLVDDELGAVVEAEVRALVAGTFLKDAPLVAVSAVTGAGLPELRAALAEEARKTPRRDPSARPARLFVDRAFTMKGFGPVVTGTLDSGTVRVEDRLVLLPPGLPVRVRGLEVHGEERTVAEAGERTSLNLAGIERAELARGQALFREGTLVPTQVVTAEVLLLAALDVPLDDGVAVRLHVGTSDTEGRLHRLAVAGAPETAGPAAPFRPGEAALVQVTTKEPVAARLGDRFILRRPSPAETLGGGRVLDALRPRAKRKAPLDAATVATLRAAEPRALAALFLAEAGPSALTAAALGPRLAVPAEAALAHLEALLSAGSALRLAPGLYAAASATAEMARRVDAVFAARKAARAPTLLLPRRELLEKVARGLDEAVAEAWLFVLAAGKRLSLDGDQAGPPGTTKGSVEDGSSVFAARIEDAFRAAGFETPRSADLARAAGTKPQVVDGLVGHLLRSGALVRLSADVVVHREAIDGVLVKLDTVKGQTLSVGGFRELLGLTRKSLIPLLEHLDQKRRTRRVGDARVVV